MPWRISSTPKRSWFGGDAPDWVIDGLMASAQPLLPSVRVRVAEASPRLRRAATQQDMAALGAATIVLFDALNPSYKWLFRSAEESDQAARSGLELLGRR